MVRKIYKNDYRGYEEKPSRSSLDKHLKYSIESHRPRIKEQLAKDFYNRCGYCGWKSNHYGSSTFDIDHIKSKSKYPDLTDDYNNYAYSCPICNTTKQAREIPGVDLDPTKNILPELLYRNVIGAIVVNINNSEDKKKLAAEIIKMFGLDKEIHKIDYISDSLDRISRSERDKELDKRDCEIICKILEIRDFIDEHFVRKTQCFRNKSES